MLHVSFKLGMNTDCADWAESVFEKRRLFPIAVSLCAGRRSDGDVSTICAIKNTGAYFICNTSNNSSTV